MKSTANWRSRKSLLILLSVALFSISLLVIKTFDDSLFDASRFIHRPSRYKNHNPMFDYGETDSPGGLSLKDFEASRLIYHADLDAFRFASNDAWRPKAAYYYIQTANNRPKMPDLHTYTSKADYMKQALVADYAKGAENIFFMIKTGATVLWDRLPVHLLTTLTRVPNFALYADSASTIGGYEVVDVLQNISAQTKEHEQFGLYRKLQQLRSAHGTLRVSKSDLDGGWALDKFKNLPMLQHAYNQNPNLDWYVFMDADSYIMVDNLMDYLEKLDPNTPLYLGCAIYLGDTMFNHGGSGVVLSRAAMQKLFDQFPDIVNETEEEALATCCGDYMVAYALLKANILPSKGYRDYAKTGRKFQGESYQKMEFTQDTWCEKVISFHHLKSLDVEMLWEYERLIGPEKRRDIQYHDIYRDFVAPYIHKIMFEWDNHAKDIVYSEEKDKEKAEEKGMPPPTQAEGKTRPWKDTTTCREACEHNKRCLSWRYLPKQNYCGLATGIRLGRPSYDWIKDEDESDLNKERIASGFMIDRIRKMRHNNVQCDAIYHSSSDDFNNDPYKEGWYNLLHMKEKLKMDAEQDAAAVKQHEDKLVSDLERAKKQVQDYKSKKAAAKHAAKKPEE